MITILVNLKKNSNQCMKFAENVIFLSFKSLTYPNYTTIESIQSLDVRFTMLWNSSTEHMTQYPRIKHRIFGQTRECLTTILLSSHPTVIITKINQSTMLCNFHPLPAVDKFLIKSWMLTSGKSHTRIRRLSSASGFPIAV